MALDRTAIDCGTQLIGFIIIGIMLLMVMQALGELAVMYPVNGAFFTYMIRFLDPSWYVLIESDICEGHADLCSRGFAMGWDYAIGWLVILPFEITAATITLDYWPHAQTINNGVWVAVFLVALICIQFFGVRGYGEGELLYLFPVR